jgi:branched-chain amino acid transport system ATP-binding protein
MPPHRRARLGIARSFQLAALFPGLTVEEQVLLAVRRAGSPDSRRRASRSLLRVEAGQLLEDWGIPKGRRSAAPAELSYGEQRALELALTLASRPSVLLLDEPNVGLTPEEAGRLIERIRGFDRQLTVVIVAHDMDVVFGVADRVVVMHRGRVHADADPATIRADESVAEIYFGGPQTG